jgi:hypothetical protein
LEEIILNNYQYIDSLFEIDEEDLELKELGGIFNEAIFILDKLIEDFKPFAFEQETVDIPDYRHYLFIFLARTKRIILSISILALYNRICEVFMLERAFIENIVNTKIFLTRKKRGKVLRKIRLYEIINDDLYCNFLKHDLDDEIESRGFTFASNIDVLKNLEEDVEKDLSRYNDHEVEKMKRSILNGIGWHGKKMKEALVISSMKDHSQTYDLSCMLLHVREPNPLFCHDNELSIDKSLMLNQLLMTLFEHINDFRTICNNVFLSLNDKIGNNKTKLMQLVFNKMRKQWEADPNRKKIIIKKEK